jgi:ATP-dependent RNA helicase DDX23/PRP28
MLSVEYIHDVAGRSARLHFRRALRFATQNRNPTTTMDSSSSSSSSFAAYLATLPPEQQAEARAAAEAAQRAEERAEQRAIEKAWEEKRRQRAVEASIALSTQQQQQQTSSSSGNNRHSTKQTKTGLVYVPKQKRGAPSSSQPHQDGAMMVADDTTSRVAAAPAAGVVRGDGRKRALASDHDRPTTAKQLVVDSYSAATSELTETERLAIQATYLGKSAWSEELQAAAAAAKKKKRTGGGGGSKKINFRFRWDETDDTFAKNDDPLYAAPAVVVPTTKHPLPRGRGRGSGTTTTGGSAAFANHNNSNRASNNNNNKRQKQERSLAALEVANMETVANKPVTAMTVRDWRIFRENYSITVKGGKSPPPMRSFRESPSPTIIPPLHPALLDAIENVLLFKEPSPIQRQAIPIGLQRRDLIGIAETGSGKTVAFGVPLCQYLLGLPAPVLHNVAVQGPLAIVLAPTRELAQQIDAEFHKLLSRQQIIRSFVVVGGQPIQNQAQEIRRGIHILVGTPGRINDCIKMSYLVLNQCCYVVMDEADRMIDMGFAPQIESM